VLALGIRSSKELQPASSAKSEPGYIVESTIGGVGTGTGTGTRSRRGAWIMTGRGAKGDAGTTNRF
jgi:hypothetical protein